MVASADFHIADDFQKWRPLKKAARTCKILFSQLYRAVTIFPTPITQEGQTELTCTVTLCCKPLGS